MNLLLLEALSCQNLQSCDTFSTKFFHSLDKSQSPPSELQPNAVPNVKPSLATTTGLLL